MANRRQVLVGLIAAALPRIGWAEAGNPSYLAAAKGADGSFVLHGIGADGGSRFAIPLPARGHAAAAHPIRPEAVAFARRPGIYALVIDCFTGTVSARLTPPATHQFNGHGAFSADGSILYTSEVVAETSEGRIGLWNAAKGYARLGDMPSGGIGPHELRRMPGEDILVVANGGIQTDPQDRSKLNTDTMRPNLSYLSPEGALIEQVGLEEDLHQNSIRHLALGPDGTVAFAMQWEGDAAEPVPLLGLHRRGEVARVCPPLDTDAFAMKGYAGSIAFDAEGRRIALTSPTGGVVQVHEADGTPVGTFARTDASGVAPAAGVGASAGSGFLVTDGGGAVSRFAGGEFTPLSRAGAAWDNHLVALQV